MKVLHIGQYYPPYPGGIETYTQSFCEGLVSKMIDVDVIVANSKNEFARETINGVRVFRMPRRGLLSSRPFCPSMPRMLKKMNKERKYDVVHLHFPNLMSEISYLFSGMKTTKLIITYHADAIHWRKSAFLINLLKILYLNSCYQYILKKSAYIICNSQSYRTSNPFLKKYQNKCHVIPIPVRNYYLSPPNQVRIQSLKDKFRDFVLFVGNFVPYKGIPYLIRAIKYTKTNLVLIGAGMENELLRNIVKEEGLEDKVYFVGRKDNQELRDFYHACTIFCLPSVSQLETYGIVLLEAMACGKPLISTEIGTGTSFININGKTGFVVQPGSPEELAEKINMIIKNVNLRIEMGNTARERVLQEFTIGRIIESLIKLYKN